MKWKQSIRAIGLLTVSCCSLLAQGDRGAVTGVVVDSSGSAIPDTTLEIVNTGTNARFDTVSTGTGAYRLVSLPVGVYDLTAKANGFSTFIQRGIQIQTNQTATVNITLSVGAVTENVTVQGGVPLIQTESADVGMVVESKQFLDMPLTLGGGIRNPSNFIKLSPGVSPTGTWTKSISGGGGFQDQIYYDGIALSRGDLSNDAEVNPSVDAIAEFKLITNNYSAEYAHAMGGVTSLHDEERNESISTARVSSSFEMKSWMPEDSSPRPALLPNRMSGAAPSAVRLSFRSSTTARTRRSGSSPSISFIAAAARSQG